MWRLEIATKDVPNNLSSVLRRARLSSNDKLDCPEAISPRVVWTFLDHNHRLASMAAPLSGGGNPRWCTTSTSTSPPFRCSASPANSIAQCLPWRKNTSTLFSTIYFSNRVFQAEQSSFIVLFDGLKGEIILEVKFTILKVLFKRVRRVFLTSFFSTV